MVTYHGQTSFSSRNPATNAGPLFRGPAVMPFSAVDVNSGRERELVVDRVESVLRKLLGCLDVAVPGGAADVRLAPRVRQHLADREAGRATESAADVLVRAAAGAGAT